MSLISVSQSSRRRFYAVGFLLTFCVSCKHGPESIPMTELVPVDAARDAISQYDKNGDGLLESAELSPSLLATKMQIDSNGDNRLTADEIAARLTSWMEKKQAVREIKCKILWKGEPLAGADIAFIPEEFLGPKFRRAGGKTSDDGVVEILHAHPDRPDPSIREGVRMGLYRIEISKKELYKETLPEQFNTRSHLGQEIAVDAAGIDDDVITLQLQ
jgi:hypothetical protein